MNTSPFQIGGLPGYMGIPYQSSDQNVTNDNRNFVIYKRLRRVDSTDEICSNENVVFIYRCAFRRVARDVTSEKEMS